MSTSESDFHSLNVSEGFAKPDGKGFSYFPEMAIVPPVRFGTAHIAACNLEYTNTEVLQEKERKIDPKLMTYGK